MWVEQSRSRSHNVWTMLYIPVRKNYTTKKVMCILEQDRVVWWGVGGGGSSFSSSGRESQIEDIKSYWDNEIVWTPNLKLSGAGQF